MKLKKTCRNLSYLSTRELGLNATGSWTQTHVLQTLRLDETVLFSISWTFSRYVFSSHAYRDSEILTPLFTWCTILINDYVNSSCFFGDSSSAIFRHNSEDIGIRSIIAQRLGKTNHSLLVNIEGHVRRADEIFTNFTKIFECITIFGFNLNGEGICHSVMICKSVICL